MNIVGLEPQSAQALFSGIIEIHELVRMHAPKKFRQEVMDAIPYTAANGFLFAAKVSGSIASMGIAGATDHPRGGIMALKPTGPHLFCYYALIEPRWRGPRFGRQLLHSMIFRALDVFPETETFCFWRGSEFHEYPRARIERLVQWEVAQESATSAMPGNGQWRNSNVSTKAPSVASRSLPSSTSSSDQPNSRIRLLGEA